MEKVDDREEQIDNVSREVEILAEKIISELDDERTETSKTEKEKKD